MPVRADRGGALPAGGALEAGLPAGAVEEAERGRELTEGGGGVLAAGAVQHPGEHLRTGGQGKLEEIMRGQLARLRGDDAAPGAGSGGGGG